jgi:ATP-dependent Clp protease protease subunit|tara:strand:- start:318 stop:935 length:618 start_codon:yes stop_codon:yes gene_type:complete
MDWHYKKGMAATTLNQNNKVQKPYKQKEQFSMSEMEWGVNSDTNTTFMNFEFDIDSLYSTIVKIDYLVRVNPKKDINLRIASYGGDVYAMLGLCDYIRGLDVKVNTHCVGTCMSAAAVLLACGTGNRTMTRHSTVMVHEGSAVEIGKSTDVMRGVDHLKELQKDINILLSEVTKKDTKFWTRVNRNDTYWDADKCLEYGLIDTII